MSNAFKATCIGLLAPLIWGLSVGLTRDITEHFGTVSGLALMYTLAFIGVLTVCGKPDFRGFPLKYLIFGVGSANLSVYCFVASIALSDGGAQTVQVGMVNYLWPCLTVIFAVLFNGVRAKLWIIPGAAVCLLGVMTVMSGDDGLDFGELAANFRANPLSYSIAFVDALLWAAYSSATKAWSGGKNPLVIITFNDMLIFGGLWLLGFGEPVSFSGGGWISVLMGAAAMSTSYAAWIRGMQKGNITVLAVASYFTPVLSCLFATWWIGAKLSPYFWQGVLLVVAGSIVCWYSTYKQESPR